jgi:DNA modification methylase
MPKPKATTDLRAQESTFDLFGGLQNESGLRPVAENREPNRRGGPPNRMNDLTYRDWMKFQKSFFRFVDWPTHINEFISFFTKQTWEDGRLSTSLLVGFDVPHSASLGRRQIVSRPGGNSVVIGKQMAKLSHERAKYDFIFVDLRTLETGLDTDQFLRVSDAWFDSLRSLLLPGRYCGIAVNWPAKNSALPIPWMVAIAGRSRLRLRDEKIGLDADGKSQHYCLFFQADGDSIHPSRWLSDQTNLSPAKVHLPVWVMPKSPPRKADEVLHPAKFPEALVEEFVELFSSPGDTIFDPMAGTGSALLAAVKSQRNAIGIELNPTFLEIARKRVITNIPRLLNFVPEVELFQGDAREAEHFIPVAKVNYCITSPPYWSMLGNIGSENQQARREKNLPTVYSQSVEDLGNIHDYDEFVETLSEIYKKLASCILPGGHLTVIVKNVKRNHTVYPLAWDLVRKLAAMRSGAYTFIGNTLWCQDDVSIKPFAVGIYWVSNTLHHYCLHFRKR